MTKVFLKAAAAGQNDKLDALLAGGVDINFADKKPGRTALIEAAIAGHANTVHFLIERGADLNRTDQTLGYTALGWAASLGHTEIVRRLIEAGANVDLTSNLYQHSPLMVAAQAGQRDVVSTLLSAGANLHTQTDSGCNALSMAESKKHAVIAVLLREHGAVPPQPIPETFLPWPERTADGVNGDDTDPASVLRGFILAMHGWEIDCAQTIGNGQDNAAHWLQGQNQIFTRFCTPKPRPYGRQGSFSSPPSYTPDEALVSIELNGSRAILMTRHGQNAPFRYEMQYCLIRKHNRWLIDNKKSRPWGTKDWTPDSL